MGKKSWWATLAAVALLTAVAQASTLPNTTSESSSAALDPTATPNKSTEANKSTIDTPAIANKMTEANKSTIDTPEIATVSTEANKSTIEKTAPLIKLVGLAATLEKRKGGEPKTVKTPDKSVDPEDEFKRKQKARKAKQLKCEFDVKLPESEIGPNNTERFIHDYLVKEFNGLLGVFSEKYINDLLQLLKADAPLTRREIEDQSLHCSMAEGAEFWCMKYVHRFDLGGDTSRLELKTEAQFVACPSLLSWAKKRLLNFGKREDPIMSWELDHLMGKVSQLRTSCDRKKHNEPIVYIHVQNATKVLSPFDLAFKVRQKVVRNMTVEAWPLSGSSGCAVAKYNKVFERDMMGTNGRLLAAVLVSLVPCLILIGAVMSGQVEVRRGLTSVSELVGEVDVGGLRRRGLADWWKATLMDWIELIPDDHSRHETRQQVVMDFNEAETELERYPALTSDDLFYYNFWDWPNSFPIPPSSERWRLINLSNWFHAATLYKAALYRYKVEEDDQQYNTLYGLDDSQRSGTSDRTALTTVTTQDLSALVSPETTKKASGKHPTKTSKNTADKYPVKANTNKGPVKRSKTSTSSPTNQGNIMDHDTQDPRPQAEEGQEASDTSVEDAAKDDGTDAVVSPASPSSGPTLSPSSPPSCP